MQIPAIPAAIAELERRRAAVDQAIVALQAVAACGPLSSALQASTGNRLSPAGRTRIVEAVRRRWERERAQRAQCAASN